MKYLLSLLIILATLFSSKFCVAQKDEVLSSLGQYADHEYYSEGDFQDYTDYAKYYYDGAVDLTDNEYFSRVQLSDMDTLNEHLYDFESRVRHYRDSCRESGEMSEIVAGYNFDRKIIDGEDYFYIDSEKQTDDDGNTWLVDYDVYIYDTQKNILYYFHNNI
jgi:hypothetical protein